MNNDAGKKAVALYARVSTLDQSCDMQLEDLRRYAAGFARSCEYVEVGVGGAQRHRPQLDQLMKDARKRIFDFVLVWKFESLCPLGKTPGGQPGRLPDAGRVDALLADLKRTAEKID